MSSSTLSGIVKTNSKVLLIFVISLSSLLLLSTGAFSQKIQFDQARNGQPTSYLITWSNGILNKTHSTYYEGMSTPQRLFLSGISGGTHTLLLKHLAVKQGSHGYDFLTSWPQAVQAATGNELQNLYSSELDNAPSEFTEAEFGPSMFSASNPNYARVAYSTSNFGSPPGYTGVDAALSCFTASYGAPYLELVGNAPIQNATCTALPGYDADYKVYSITWTSASTNVFVRFAGHLAVGAGPCGYGAGLGASNINGGPYHIKLLDLDDQPMGERDNQVMCQAISPRPFCAITPSALTICQGGTATFTGPAGLANYSWSITPSTGATLNSTTGQTVVVTGMVAGTYTVTLSTSMRNNNSIHSIKLCDASLVVLPTITVSAGNYTVCAGSVVTLSGSPSGGTWSGTHVTGSVFNAAGVAPGTYTATYTYTNTAGCTVSAIANITVSALPTVTATATPSLLYNGQSSTLSALGSVGGIQNNSLFTSFTWSAVMQPGYSNGIAYLNSISGASVTFTPPNIQANYKFMVTATTAAGCTATATVTIGTTGTASCNVTASANNATVCSGSTVALVGSPASGTWSGDHVSGSTFNAAGVAAGNYTVSYTVTNGGCSTTTTATVTVYPLPVITINSAAVCMGSTITLTASPTGGTWSGANVTSAGFFNATTLPAGSYSVTYTVTNSNNCTSSANAMVTVASTINATADNKTVCIGSTVNLTGTPSGGTWSGAHVSGNTFSAVGLSAGTYTVTYTFINGNCSSSANATITVVAAPSLVINSASVCAGSTVSLTASPSGGTWSGANVNSAGLFNAAGLSAGTYPVTYTYNNGTCTTSANGMVTVLGLPVVTATNTTVCAGASVSLSGSPSGGTWSGAHISSAGLFSAAGLTAGTYTVTYTYNNGSCTGSANATVTVLALPVITATSTSVCAGSSVSLSGTPSGGTWSGANVSSAGWFNAANLTAGTYSVTYTYNNGSCTASANATVTVLASSVVTANNASVCQGSTVALTGSPSGGTWTGANVSSAGMFNATGLTAGTYSVTYTYNNGNCTGMANATVTVLALPVVTATNTSVCAGSTVSLSGNPSGGTWSGANISNAGVFNAAGLSAGTYTVTYTYNNGSCTNTANATVTVLALPIVTATSTSVCAGTSASLSGTPSGGTWSGANVSSTGVFNAAGLTAGTYSVTYTYNNGSCTASANATVTVLAASVVTASNASVCQGSTVNLNGLPAGGTWTGANVSSTGVFNAAGLAAGNYSVTYTFNNGNCTGTANAIVTVNALPAITGTLSVCQGSTTQLAGSASPATTNAWSSSNVAIATVSATGLVTGISAGSAVITYMNSNGCQTTATVMVNALPTANAGVDQALCQTAPSAPTMFTLAGIASGGSTVWTQVGQTGTATATISNPSSLTSSVSVSGVGTVTLQLTITSSSCGTATDNVVLTVNTSAVVNAGQDQTLCETAPSGPTLFTLAGTATAGTTVWTQVGQTGTATATISNPSSLTSGVSVSGVGTVTLRLSSTTTCGTATDDVVLTVAGLPSVTATATPATLTTTGQTSTLSALGSVGGVQNNSLFTSFTWSAVTQPGYTNGIAFLSSTSGATVTFSPPPVANVNYKFMVTATTAAGCTATATVTVITSASYGCTVTATANNATVCSGSTVTLTGSPANGTWTSPYVTGSTFNAAGLAAGTYTVSYTVTSGGCSTTTTATVTVTNCNAVTLGCTLGFWKNHPAIWNEYTDAVVMNMPAGTGAGQQFTTSTLFEYYFPGTYVIDGITSTTTMLDVLNLQGGGCIALARNAVAALLSKAAFGNDYAFPGSYADLYNTILSTLNGTNSTYNCTTLNDALDAANNNEKNNACSNLGTPGATPRITVMNPSASTLTVAASPNPFTSRIRFTIRSTERGHAQLELHNMMGQRIAVVFDGYLEANVNRDIEFNVPSSAPQNLFYSLNMRGQHVTGKLVKVDQ